MYDVYVSIFFNQILNFPKEIGSLSITFMKLVLSLYYPEIKHFCFCFLSGVATASRVKQTI